LASDLPDPIAIARKRLAAVAERRAAGARLGFGTRAVPGGTGSAPDALPDVPPPTPEIGSDAEGRRGTAT